MKRKNKILNKNNYSDYFKNLKFKIINLTLAKQIIILGCIITFFSLYMPWVKDIEKNLYWTSFNSISGNIGYLLILILFFSFFIIFSTNYKEKIKLYSDISIKNHFFIITFSFIIICFSIISISFINGLNTFFENIIYGKGVILSMTGGFIMLFGGFLLRRDYYLDNSEIILDKLNQNRQKSKKEDNMKLPF